MLKLLLVFDWGEATGAGSGWRCGEGGGREDCRWGEGGPLAVAVAEEERNGCRLVWKREPW